MNIKVEYTGRYPNLCSGKWKISVDGETLSIPEALINSSMGTFKTYNTWHFDEDWNEVFTDYEDGEFFEEWIKKNAGWIMSAFRSIGKLESVKLEDLRVLYEGINKVDWRHLSCGGCI